MIAENYFQSLSVMNDVLPTLLEMFVHLIINVKILIVLDF